ncbi:hypothetical protein [Aidingimonas lacisalsi]|uniref:hypothetical protein n=1 Tax=Aidingimonas lacisalsi TaxID=2604086 RepID=UPI0011D2962B|nr:hypothetical protein [Aidingimonas lacisalsi]
MPVFTIEPMTTTTVGGFPATISGINTGSTDFIVGTIDAPAGVLKAMWDSGGVCRDSNPKCNLNTHTNEFIEVLEAAKAL